MEKSGFETYSSRYCKSVQKNLFSLEKYELCMGVTTSRKFYDHLNVLFIHSGAKSSGLIHLVPKARKKNAKTYYQI